MTMDAPDTFAAILVREVACAVEGARNEAQLRHEIEKSLQTACASLGIAWVPFQLERRVGGRTAASRFVDVAHGAVVIEYEPPASFAGRVGAKLRHARAQAEEYGALLADEEGRPIGAYLLVAWDGAHLDFGRWGDGVAQWEGPVAFGHGAASRLLQALADDGRPLVHPRLLAQIAGPDSPFGASLMPRLFTALISAQGKPASARTALLYAEWRRLFGQVVGVQSTALKTLLARQGTAHGAAYGDDPAAFLFALHTYIALLAKLVAALALPAAAIDLRQASTPIAVRIQALESGTLFTHAGIENMLSGDFFSWYLDDASWTDFAPDIERLLARLCGVDFEVSRKSAGATRDLFKGIYEAFAPRALRHALGEFYTPDWLAEYGLDALGWRVDEPLLDPTCGSGTFLLEALRRRLESDGAHTAATLLQGLAGFDLNPLAVLTAKGSLAVYVAPYLDPLRPVRLPVFLADAVNSVRKDIDGIYAHVLQTELGLRQFRLPAHTVTRSDFFALFGRLRELVDADLGADAIVAALTREFEGLHPAAADASALRETVATLCELHRRGWNGIWCPIVADRFAAGAIEPVGVVCGNPPWVKWSHLPPDYAAFIQPRCAELGVFSSDRWVGGIEFDMSTVITFEVIDKYLAPGGRLGFFITGTVFANESSAGFRQFRLHDGGLTCAVTSVDDFTSIAPFDGVSNRPVFMQLERNRVTRFPLPYRIWSVPKEDGRRQRSFRNAAEFRALARCDERLAQPVPGGNGSRPWLIGTAVQHRLFAQVFRPGGAEHLARKGVTTDRNGIFWVTVLGAQGDAAVRIENAAAIGRTKGIPSRRAAVESQHLFPLLRGRGVEAFRATPDAQLHILVPQRGMHGDPELPLHSPLTHRFLKSFEDELRGRSSYRRFQARAGHPFYSLWSTGTYTFAPWKVLWREMGGGGFAAAYVGSHDDPWLGRRVVVPDHKLYFIPLQTEAEAAYLTGFLNAPVVAGAVAAYASQLSLGASVAEYLHVPAFDARGRQQVELARIARSITARQTAPKPDEWAALDACARQLLGIEPESPA